MRFAKSMVFGLVLLVLAGKGLGQEKFEIDPTHSNIGFTVRHMVVAKVDGGFKEFFGTILYDEKDLKKSSVNVTIKAASINTQNERRDNHLRGEDFFNTVQDSLITFVSKKIEKRGEGWVAVGDLTIRGITKEIVLPFKILGRMKDPRGNARLGLEATTSIDRFDYNVRWDHKLDDGNLVVSQDVDITIQVEAIARTPQAQSM